jgi:hypothetical protein
MMARSGDFLRATGDFRSHRLACPLLEQRGKLSLRL